MLNAPWLGQDVPEAMDLEVESSGRSARKSLSVNDSTTDH